MTRRERLTAKLERREEWADRRRAEAAALLKRNEPYRGECGREVRDERQL